MFRQEDHSTCTVDELPTFPVHEYIARMNQALIRKKSIATTDLGMGLDTYYRFIVCADTWPTVPT